MNDLQKGLAIADLVDKWGNVNTGDVSQWVARGLMAPEEFADYEAYHKLESVAYNAGRKAEEALPKPNWDAGLPTEFIALRALHSQKKTQLEAYRRALHGAQSFDGYHGHERLRNITLDAKGKALAANLDAKVAELAGEVSALDRRLEARKRPGSVFHKVNDPKWSAYQAAQRKANHDAQQAVFHANPDVVRKGKLAEQAYARRVQKRRAAILAEIAALFEQTTAEVSA